MQSPECIHSSPTGTDFVPPDPVASSTLTSRAKRGVLGRQGALRWGHGGLTIMCPADRFGGVPQPPGPSARSVALLLGADGAGLFDGRAEALEPPELPP
ncbi:hypothetical protein GCM10010211_71720 [Streptomyces albospinus]|uniref:Uncharacterized protein n=1 Tax=Streptomyces albospinus TaxID=285515 RepID=A0ABQ2VN00_9ACTN|nr:hypothetical protein GCM10010211_71720 [Streptomyces albospinus]